MSEYRILALGDIVGQEPTEKVCRVLPALKREYKIDFTVANGENAAQGNGLDRRTAEKLLSGGIDVLTSGNHIWQKKEMVDYIDENSKHQIGDEVEWRQGEHCMVLIGYDQKDFLLADSVAGKVSHFERKLAEQRFKELGSQAIVCQ
jgi:calcineurin-like phosphoesterase